MIDDNGSNGRGGNSAVDGFDSRAENGGAGDSNYMTKKERRYFMFGAIKAALVMWAVMMGGIVLFVLFCVFIWLR